MSEIKNSTEMPSQSAQKLKGYKVTDVNMQCRSFQFELGKKYTVGGKISICNNGFHFCELPQHCFNYYDFTPSNRVFEVEGEGENETNGDKTCVRSITLVRELSWEEVLRIVNTGICNSGHSNSGNCNSGYRNSGNCNSGDRNSGNCNSGDRNSGDSNSGYRNSGNCNSGDRNSGDSNSGYRNSGVFCTDNNPVVWMFDSPTTIAVRDWENSRPYAIMCNLENCIWVPSSLMSEEEKKANPKHETTEGYLKIISLKESWKNLWHNLDEKSRAEFTNLPNFDAKKFEDITGIKITQDGKK